jgi:hypothetical protein
MIEKAKAWLAGRPQWQAIGRGVIAGLIIGWWI